MIRTLAFRSIRIDTLQGLDDATPADELADNVELLGIIHEPVVTETLHVVCGRRRILALRALGALDVVCKVVESDLPDKEAAADELRLWTISENAYRAHMTADEHREAIREAFEVARRMRERLPPPEPVKRKRGRPRKVGVKEVAAALGVKPTVVAAALLPKRPKRPRKPRGGAPPPAPEAPIHEPHEEDGQPPAPPPPAWTLETWGLEIAPEWLAAVEAYDTALGEVAGRLTVAVGALTALLSAIEAGKAEGPRGRLERLRDDLKRLAAMARGQLPACLCAYCKGTDEARPTCAACLGCAVLVRDQQDGVPAELTDGSRRISIGGRIVEMEGAAPALAEVAKEEVADEEGDRMPWD